jgi:hypothetical protein
VCIKLHLGFAARERDIDFINPVNRLQRFCYLADATTSSHTRYLQYFRLHAIPSRECRYHLSECRHALLLNRDMIYLQTMGTDQEIFLIHVKNYIAIFVGPDRTRLGSHADCSFTSGVPIAHSAADTDLNRDAAHCKVLSNSLEGFDQCGLPPDSADTFLRRLVNSQTA